MKKVAKCTTLRVGNWVELFAEREEISGLLFEEVTRVGPKNINVSKIRGKKKISR